MEFLYLESKSCQAACADKWSNLLHYPAFQWILATPAYVRHKISHSCISEHWVPNMCPASDSVNHFRYSSEQSKILSFTGGCCPVAKLYPTVCNPMDCSAPGFLSFSISRSLLTLMSVMSVMPSSHLVLCCPLLFPPLIFPSIRIFSSESVLHIRWPKYWSFSFNISPSSEHRGLIFRMDWLDLLAVQGTLKSLLQHHSSKASILWHSAFFIVQLSHPYMSTGKTIAWLDGLLLAK